MILALNGMECTNQGDHAVSLTTTGSILILLLLPTASWAFERHTCTETWYETGIRDSIHNKRSAYKMNDCPAPEDKKTELKTGYQVIDGRVYWVSSSSKRYSPCQGQGVGSLGQIITPTCYLPAILQTHENVEQRNYWRVTEDIAHFRPARSGQPALTPAQQDRVDLYAVDQTSVYYLSDKIDGADPESFEVMFPFDDDAKLKRYAVSRDSQHAFINGYSLPLIDLSNVQWLDLPCTGDIQSCRSTEYAAPMIGKVGRDVLYLDNRARPTVFPGLATSKIACSREGFKNYCVSGGKRYLIDFGVMTSARLVEQPAE